MHKTSLIAAAGLCAALSTACNKDAGKAEPAAEAEGEAPAAAKTAEPAAAAPEFEISAERVVVTDSLATNATYAEQGLGLKAEEGKTFVCAFYSITNTGSAAAYGEMPVLVAADGSEHQVSVEAAGNLPTEWASSFANAKIEPGASQSGPQCFQVPTAAAEGALKLRFVDKGNMSGEGAWEKTVELPAAGAEGAEGEAADPAAAAEAEAAADQAEAAEGAEAAE